MDLHKRFQAWVCAIVALVCVFAMATVGLADVADPYATAWDQARARMVRTLESGRKPVPHVIALDIENAQAASGGYVFPGFAWGMSVFETQRQLGVALMPMAGAVAAAGGGQVQTFAPSYDEYTLFSVGGQLALGSFEFEDDQLVAVTLTVLTDHPGMKKNDPGALYTVVAAALSEGGAAVEDVFTAAMDVEAVTLAEAELSLVETAGWEAFDAEAGQTAVRVAVFAQDGAVAGASVVFGRVETTERVAHVEGWLEAAKGWRLSSL